MPVKKGYKQTEEHKAKLKVARKGRKPNLGKTWKLSEKTKNKMREKKIGKRHWNWQGGISKISARIRNCFKYRQWRSDIFTRDDFTCIICEERGCYLEADHYPKLFSEIVKEYKIDCLDKALECEELWNMNNGRTLCKDCHRKHGRKR